MNKTWCDLMNSEYWFKETGLGQQMCNDRHKFILFDSPCQRKCCVRYIGFILLLQVLLSYV